MMSKQTAVSQGEVTSSFAIVQKEIGNTCRRINNDAGGPAKVVIRYHPDVTLDDVEEEVS